MRVVLDTNVIVSGLNFPGNEAENLILGCAAEASADYLVTGARLHLLPLGKHGSVRILNASRFLFALEA